MPNEEMIHSYVLHRERGYDREYIAEHGMDQINSRYRKLRRYIDEKGRKFVETPERLYIPESDDDVEFQVGPEVENRIDLIAHRFYGDHRFFWIIAIANDLHFPYDVAIGDIIRIPPLEVVIESGGVLSLW